MDHGAPQAVAVISSGFLLRVQVFLSERHAESAGDFAVPCNVWVDRTRLDWDSSGAGLLTPTVTTSPRGARGRVLANMHHCDARCRQYSSVVRANGVRLCGACGRLARYPSGPSLRDLGQHSLSLIRSVWRPSLLAGLRCGLREVVRSS